MFSKHSLSIAAGALFLAAPLTVFAQATVPAGDLSFMKKAAVGGMAEVELGQLAQQHGSSAQVKEFGARMVQDHSKANDELKHLAGAKGVTLPTALDSKNQKVVDRMQKMSGVAFDHAYMSDMVADHKEDIADFRKEGQGGKDPDVKAFATKTLPTLEEHLKMAQSGNGMAPPSSMSPGMAPSGVPK